MPAEVDLLESRTLLSATSLEQSSAASDQLPSTRLVEFFNSVETLTPDELAVRHAEFARTLELVLGEPVSVSRSYRYALNAITVELTDSQAQIVGQLEQVRVVFEDEYSQLQSNSAEQTGAGAIWEGTAIAGVDGTYGEGILIGIIDSGIDFDNPSFAAVGPEDQYVHVNPFGAGSYLGVCDPQNPDYDESLTCNDKIVGAYDFTADTAINDAGFADHGTSVAGIAAGNIVEVEVPGTTTTTQISGVAPHANLISYDVCDSSDGCSNAAIVAAIDQAIADGVDVINMSIGGPSESPWNAVMAQAMWQAHNAGIFVAVSAGNGGPDSNSLTAPADAPWVAAVAAGRSGDEVVLTVGVADADAPAELQEIVAIRGQSVSVDATIGPAGIRHTADVFPGSHLGSDALPEGALANRIALIDRGESLFAEKVANAHAAGAIGIVVVNNVPGSPIVMAGVEDVPVPSVMISQQNGALLRDWLRSNPDAQFRIDAQRTEPLSVVAAFSSRGENEQSETLAPHITAPGSDFSVIAPTATLGVDNWDYFSGTSAASPHVAGAAALLTAIHPDWTPSEIQSALQLTARTGDVVNGAKISATPFESGSGFLEVGAAAATGLILDESSSDFLAANPQTGGDTRQLNLPGFVARDVESTVSWTRFLKSTQSVGVTWAVEIESDDGLTLEPVQSTLEIAGEQISEFALNATVADGTSAEWLFGSVRMIPNAELPVITFPVAVRALAVPDVLIQQTGSGTDTSESGATDEYTIRLATVPEGVVNLRIDAPSDLEVSSDGESFSAGIEISSADAFARTIYVRAIDDALAESTQRVSIKHSVIQSTSQQYPVDFAIEPLPVQIFDNDSGSLTLSFDSTEFVEGTSIEGMVSRSANSDLTENLQLRVTSGGSLVVVDSQGIPTSSIVIPAGATLIPVRVVAVDNFTIDGQIDELLVVQAPMFQAATQEFRVIDNDAANLKAIESNGSTVVTRKGAADDFTVELRAQPKANVEFVVVSENSSLVDVDLPRLVFTPNNWTTPQTLTVTGRSDGSSGADEVVVRLTVDPSVSDPDFHQIEPVEVAVFVVDGEGALPQIIGPRGRVVSDPVVFRWAPVKDAVSYRVYAERADDAGTPVVDVTVSDVQYVPPPLGIGRYRFWVKAVFGDAGETVWIGDTYQIATAPHIDPLPYYATQFSPKVSWSEVPGASSYQVYVSNITTGQNAIVNQSGLTVREFIPAEGFEFGVHRIWVRAVDQFGTAGDWSAPLDYNIGPRLVSPLSSTFDSSPLFEWTDVPGAEAYEFFARLPGGTVVAQTLQTTNLKLQESIDVGTVYWWVRALGSGDQKGPWSERGEAFIGGRTSITGPIGTTSNRQPTLEWLNVTGAGSYEVFLNRIDSVAEVHQETVENSRVQVGPLSDGDYRVWVRPVSADGTLGLWSSPRDFTVSGSDANLIATPNDPVLVSFTNTPLLSWNHVEGAAGYDVTLQDGDTKIEVTSVQGTAWQTPDLGETQAFWRVRAVDVNGLPGPWSELASIDTTGRAVGFSPIVSGGNVEFRWSTVLGADRYILHVDNLTTGESAIIRDDQLRENTFTTLESPAAGTYRFWIRAIRNQNPEEGFWSVPVDYTVD